MDGSNGNITSLLERIVDELKQTREEQVRTREELVELRQETRNGFERLGERVDRLGTRLDNAIGFMGTHHRDHEQRIRVLEEHVLGPKPKRKRR